MEKVPLSPVSLPPHVDAGGQVETSVTRTNTGVGRSLRASSRTSTSTLDLRVSRLKPREGLLLICGHCHQHDVSGRLEGQRLAVRVESTQAGGNTHTHTCRLGSSTFYLLGHVRATLLTVPSANSHVHRASLDGHQGVVDFDEIVRAVSFQVQRVKLKLDEVLGVGSQLPLEEGVVGIRLVREAGGLDLPDLVLLCVLGELAPV